MKKVSIITVNFNQPAVTEEFLHSIKTTCKYENIEIVVVDNGSKENHVPQWIEMFSGIRFLRSAENLGFAGGNNMGIKEATGDYLFLVNNDTEFTPGLVESLVAILDSDPKIGMVSPKIRYHQDKNLIQYAGFTP